MHYTQDGADDEPAFPVTSAAEHQFCGMSLRDAFAMRALQGFLSGFQTRGYSITPDMQDQIAAGMYSMAEAMLKARAAIAQAGGEQ